MTQTPPSRTIRWLGDAERLEDAAALIQQIQLAKGGSLSERRRDQVLIDYSRTQKNQNATNPEAPDGGFPIWGARLTYSMAQTLCALHPLCVARVFPESGTYEPKGKSTRTALDAIAEILTTDSDFLADADHEDLTKAQLGWLQSMRTNGQGEFVAWMRIQVGDWGLNPDPLVEALRDAVDELKLDRGTPLAIVRLSTTKKGLTADELKNANVRAIVGPAKGDHAREGKIIANLQEAAWKKYIMYLQTQQDAVLFAHKLRRVGEDAKFWYAPAGSVYEQTRASPAYWGRVLGDPTHPHYISEFVDAADVRKWVSEQTSPDGKGDSKQQPAAEVKEDVLQPAVPAPKSKGDSKRQASLVERTLDLFSKFEGNALTLTYVVFAWPRADEADKKLLRETLITIQDAFLYFRTQLEQDLKKDNKLDELVPRLVRHAKADPTGNVAAVLVIDNILGSSTKEDHPLDEARRWAKILRPILEKSAGDTTIAETALLSMMDQWMRAGKVVTSSNDHFDVVVNYFGLLATVFLSAAAAGHLDVKPMQGFEARIYGLLSKLGNVDVDKPIQQDKDAADVLLVKRMFLAVTSMTVIMKEAVVKRSDSSVEEIRTRSDSLWASFELAYGKEKWTEFLRYARGICLDKLFPLLEDKPTEEKPFVFSMLEDKPVASPVKLADAASPVKPEVKDEPSDDEGPQGLALESESDVEDLSSPEAKNIATLQSAAVKHALLMFQVVAAHEALRLEYLVAARDRVSGDALFTLKNQLDIAVATIIGQLELSVGDAGDLVSEKDLAPMGYGMQAVLAAKLTQKLLLRPELRAKLNVWTGMVLETKLPESPKWIFARTKGVITEFVEATKRFRAGLVENQIEGSQVVAAMTLFGTLIAVYRSAADSTEPLPEDTFAKLQPELQNVLTNISYSGVSAESLAESLNLTIACIKLSEAIFVHPNDSRGKEIDKVEGSLKNLATIKWTEGSSGELATWWIRQQAEFLLQLSKKRVPKGVPKGETVSYVKRLVEFSHSAEAINISRDFAKHLIDDVKDKKAKAIKAADKKAAAFFMAERKWFPELQRVFRGVAAEDLAKALTDRIEGFMTPFGDAAADESEENFDKALKKLSKEQKSGVARIHATLNHAWDVKKKEIRKTILEKQPTQRDRVEAFKILEFGDEGVDLGNLNLPGVPQSEIVATLAVPHDKFAVQAGLAILKEAKFPTEKVQALVEHDLKNVTDAGSVAVPITLQAVFPVTEAQGKTRYMGRIYLTHQDGLRMLIRGLRDLYNLNWTEAAIQLVRADDRIPPKDGADKDDVERFYKRRFMLALWDHTVGLAKLYSLW